MARRKIPKQLDTVIRQYLARLDAEKLPITNVYLFGSYAKGTEHEWSDVDLCVISPRFKNPLLAIQYLIVRRLSDMNYPIEPVGMTLEDFNDGGALAAEIKKTGIKIR